MKLFLSKNLFLLLLAGWTCTQGYAQTAPSPGFASAETKEAEGRNPSKASTAKEATGPAGGNPSETFATKGTNGPAGKKPSEAFATRETIGPAGKNPSETFATREATGPAGSKPSEAFATKETTGPAGKKPSEAFATRETTGPAGKNPSETFETKEATGLSGERLSAGISAKRAIDSAGQQHSPALFGKESIDLTAKPLSGSFAEREDPERIGKKLALHYASAPFRNFDGIESPPSEVTYPEVCAWFGALKFAARTEDDALLKKLEARFLPLLGSNKELMQQPDHVDHTVFGVVPLQLYLQTGVLPYYYIGIDFADRQWQLPAGATDNKQYKEYLEQGLSWQTRFWIDDMFMISAIQSQAYLASGEEKYINRAADEMVVYLDAMQQENGLFYHSGDSPFYWCRGNGWMAAGMTELLKHLPEENPHFERILSEYRKMMHTLKSFRNDEGLWNQLIDEEEAWTETSGSAMFTYAMITGLNKGWLKQKEYAPVVREAWSSLVGYLEENGDIRNVSQGTNTGDNKAYYLNRRQITGDLHGQAPMLWCATALLEK